MLTSMPLPSLRKAPQTRRGWAAAACLALLISAGGGAAAQASNDATPLVTADKVVVRKSERRLYLFRGGEVVKSYPVKLGLNPVGHKEREGDFRTPEGRYWLARRNPRSDYFLAIQVSYPNAEDMRYAQKNRWRPGGSIMIHGQPNVLKRSPAYYQSSDWTNGCIALSNDDMLEVWLLTSSNTPIEILP
jgi:murein L,D-transpeptidase YafK